MCLRINWRLVPMLFRISGSLTSRRRSFYDGGGLLKDLYVEAVDLLLLISTLSLL